MSQLSIRYTIDKYFDARETREWRTKFNRTAGAATTIKQRKTLKQYMTQQIMSPNVTTFRIRHDGEVIGYLSCSDYTGINCLDVVYIDKKHQGKGHFHNLMPNAIHMANIQSVLLTNTTFEAHREYYATLGFNIPTLNQHSHTVIVMSQATVDSLVKSGALAIQTDNLDEMLTDFTPNDTEGYKQKIA